MLHMKDHSIKRAGNFERSFDCLTPILIKEMTLRESKDMHKRRGNPLTSRPCSVDNYTPSQPSPPTGGVLDDRSDNIDQNPGVGGCSTPRHGLLSPVDRGNAGSYRGGGEGVGGDDVERLIASGFDQGRDQLTSSSSASCGLLQDENDDDSDDENIPEPRVPDLAEVAKVITTPRMMLRPDADGDFGYEVGGYSTTDEPLDDTPPTSAGHAPRLHRQRGGESRGRAGGGTTEGGSSCGEAMRGESGQIIQDQEEGEGGTAAIEGRVKSSSEIDVPYVDPMRFGETEFNPTRCDAYDLNWRSTIKASNLSSIECSWLDKVQRLARLERMTRQDETTFRCRAKTNRPATSFSVRRKNKNDQTTGDSTSETLPSFSPTTTTTTTTPTSNRLTSNRSSGCLSPRPSAPPPPPQPSVMSHSHPRTTSASGETVSPPRSLQPAKPCLSDCLQTACIGDCTGRRATIPTPVPMLTAPPRGGSATAVNGACGAVGVDKTSPSLATPPSFAIATPPVLPSGTAFPVTCPPESYDLYKRGSVTIVYTKQRPQSSLATSRRAARRLQQQQHVLQTEQVKSRPQSSATSTRTLATRTTVSSTKSSSNSTSGPRCSSGKKRRPKTAKS